MLWSQSHPGVHVDQTDQAFVNVTLTNLNTIYSRPVGKDLLDLISKRCQGIGTKVNSEKNKVVVIKKTDNLGSVSQDPMKKDDRDVASAAVPDSIVRLPGLGTGSIVLYSPTLDYTAALGIQTPAFIALAHELIHAFHSLNGDFREAYSWATQGALHEEARTVGIGPYKGQRISENTVRKEHSLPARLYYNSPDDADALTGVT